MTWNLEYWYDSQRRRQLTSPAEDISQLYFNLGTMLSFLINASYEDNRHQTITIRLNLKH